MARRAASSLVNLVTGKVERFAGSCRCYRYRRLRQYLLPVDQRHGFQRIRRHQVYKKGAYFANPLMLRFIHLYPVHGEKPVETDIDVGVAA